MYYSITKKSIFSYRYVFWYHFERMVNYDLPTDSSVSVKTSTSPKGMTRSILTIKEAQPADAGNYTCKPSNAIAASIQVFVSEGIKILSLGRRKFLNTPWAFGIWCGFAV